MRKILDNVFLLTLVSAFAGGSIVVAAKIALEVLQPFTVVFLRFSTATLFLIPLIIHRKSMKTFNIKSFIPIGLIGALNPILLFLALPYTQASISPLIYASVPAMTALYIFIRRKEKPESKHLLGITIGLIGVALIVLVPLIEKSLPLTALKGNLLIFLAAIAFMFYGILSKTHMTHHKGSPILLTFYFSVVTMILSVPFMIGELRTTQLGNVNFVHLFASLWTGIVGTGIFYLAYQLALRKSGEIAASLFTYLQPVATIVIAVPLLGEKITPIMIIGGVMAIFGARLAGKQ